MRKSNAPDRIAETLLGWKESDKALQIIHNQQGV
jgi:hypothetical protein